MSIKSLPLITVSVSGELPGQRFDYVMPSAWADRIMTISDRSTYGPGYVRSVAYSIGLIASAVKSGRFDYAYEVLVSAEAACGIDYSADMEALYADMLDYYVVTDQDDV
jgi:hypothetical protein